MVWRSEARSGEPNFSHGCCGRGKSEPAREGGRWQMSRIKAVPIPTPRLRHPRRLRPPREVHVMVRAPRAWSGERASAGGAGCGGRCLFFFLSPLFQVYQEEKEKRKQRRHRNPPARDQRRSRLVPLRPAATAHASAVPSGWSGWRGESACWLSFRVEETSRWLFF